MKKSEELKYVGLLYGMSIYCEERDVERMNILSRRFLEEQQEYHDIIESRLYKIVKKITGK